MSLAVKVQAPQATVALRFVRVRALPIQARQNPIEVMRMEMNQDIQAQKLHEVHLQAAKLHQDILVELTRMVPVLLLRHRELHPRHRNKRSSLHPWIHPMAASIGGLPASHLRKMVGKSCVAIFYTVPKQAGACARSSGHRTSWAEQRKQFVC